MEEVGQHEVMPSRFETNIVTVSDMQIPYAAEGRAYFIDVDKGKYLGALNTGYWYGGVILPKKRNEIISAETYFERGTRGKRTDVVAFYDPITLENTGEVIIPSKRMTPVKPQGTSALTDDEKFLAVVNVTPATSLSIVDLDKREFTAEIEVPGCTNVYAIGDRRFNVICADGSFMNIELDDQGQLAKRSRRAPSFNPQIDPVTNSGVRVDNSWYHVSQQSHVYQFTTAADGNITTDKWDLLTKEEREDNWRIGGMQNLAIHKASQHLYVLMIQGGPEEFEDATDQVWVYDLKTKKRINMLELENPAWHISVSQSAAPRLYSIGVNFHMPHLFVMWIYFTQGKEELLKMAKWGFDTYDASTGEHIFTIPRIGTLPNLIQPWK
ncbi:hypothetical protein R50073_44510 [Maricurvus nonylphenolicus]